MSLNHEDWCTHIKNPEDKDILTRKLFDVNMRLFHINEDYRRIVEDCCNYIGFSCVKEKDGYKQPHGWSGANAGIPFNIIAVMHKYKPLVMINPVIISHSNQYKQVKSNCGSLTLEKPRIVSRLTYITVRYHDINGDEQVWEDIPATPGFTIQHELQHNQGILITDLK